MSGKLIKIDVNGNETTHVWAGKGPPPFELLKGLVEGWIERVQVRWENRLRDAYVNEEGLVYGLAPNEKASLLTDGRSKDTFIVGPMVIWVPDGKKEPK